VYQRILHHRRAPAAINSINPHSQVRSPRLTSVSTPSPHISTHRVVNLPTTKLRFIHTSLQWLCRLFTPQPHRTGPHGPGTARPESACPQASRDPIIGRVTRRCALENRPADHKLCTRIRMSSRHRTFDRSPRRAKGRDAREAH
jgi:hypothetical protein